jgi:hypothetical protein
MCDFLYNILYIFIISLLFKLCIPGHAVGRSSDRSPVLRFGRWLGGREVAGKPSGGSSGVLIGWFSSREAGRLGGGWETDWLVWLWRSSGVLPSSLVCLFFVFQVCMTFTVYSLDFCDLSTG